MATYTAEIVWSRGEQTFTDQRYSRKHLLRFDGGVLVTASSSPHVVPVPYSALDAVDPEEALVASLSSCHMLWFLSIAAAQGYVVDDYHDLAEGVMGKNAQGRFAMSIVTLRPRVRFAAGRTPSAAELAALHQAAHEECYIAASVRSEVRCEPRQAKGAEDFSLRSK